MRETDKNNKTNFGFDGFDSKTVFGQIPLKGQVNQTQANQTMEYLKRSHIELGNESQQNNFVSSQMIGKSAESTDVSKER